MAITTPLVHVVWNFSMTITVIYDYTVGNSFENPNRTK
jgi:hypothetical protein